MGSIQMNLKLNVEVKSSCITKSLNTKNIAIAIPLVIVVGEVFEHPESLISGFGFLVFLVLFFVFSHDPAGVKWQPVVGGFMLQMLVAIFVLKTKVGFCFFEYLGGQVEQFLKYTDKGWLFLTVNSNSKRSCVRQSTAIRNYRPDSGLVVVVFSVIFASFSI